MRADMRATEIALPPRLSERIARALSSWILLIALLTFVLPFVSVSCATPAGHGSAGGGVTTRYTGIRLVVGGDPMLEAVEGAPTPGAPKADDQVPPQPLFALALGLVAVGVVASDRLKKRRAGAVAGVTVGAAVAALAGLVTVDRWLTDRIVATLTRQANPRLASTDPASYVNFDVGFLVLIALLLVTTVLNAIPWVRGRS